MGHDTFSVRQPSFWMGGFECADHLNAFGQRVDMLALTQHRRFLDDDYRNLRQLQIHTVREGIQWSRVERRPNVYDWEGVSRIMDAGDRWGIEQIWDLCHFGFPDDLTPLHPLFARRFAGLCRAFAKFWGQRYGNKTAIVTPINEVSFLSWLGGDVRGTSPFCVGQGWEVKYRLMKAYIEGIEALKEVNAATRILSTEPLIHIIAGDNAIPSEITEARHQNDNQFQVLDILGGRMCPELRGRPEYLDLLGVNFYYNNQWVHRTHEILPWNNPRELRWVPLHQLLAQIYQRYRRPIILSETSHPKEDRPLWMQSIGSECRLALESGVPLQGVCWYPLVDRPDWDNLNDWHRSGIWDVGLDLQEEGVRTVHEPTLKAFAWAQEEVGRALPAQLKVNVPVDHQRRSDWPASTVLVID